MPLESLAGTFLRFTLDLDLYEKFVIICHSEIVVRYIIYFLLYEAL